MPFTSTPTTKISGSYSTFSARCTDLARRLLAVPGTSDRCEHLLRKVRELSEEFETWVVGPPPPELRAKRTIDLLTLQRDVEEYLSH